MQIPSNCIGWITGNRGSELRRVERETGTYIFMAADKYGDERLLIFGVNPGSKGVAGGRHQAKTLIEEMVQERLSRPSRLDTPERFRGDSRERPRGGRGRDSRSPSYRRRPAHNFS